MMEGTPDREALPRRRLLGWNLRCEPTRPGVDHGRDLVLRPGPDGTDLAAVEGIDCLVQDLALALTTLRGSDVLNENFGFDGLAAMAEDATPVLTQERIRVAVVAALRRDPRVRRVVDVKLEDARLEPPEPGSRELGVRVALDATTGDTVTIDLEGLHSVV